MTAVTGSDLYSQAWKVTYNVISGNVTDPVSRGGSKWIFSDFPEIQKGAEDDFPGYPIITIDNFSNDTELPTFQMGPRDNMLATTITVHTKTRQQIDPINSDIYSAFSIARSSMIDSGLKPVDYTTEPTDTITLDRNNRIHIKDNILTLRCQV